MSERREIFPRDQLRKGQTAAPRDRRQLCTGLEYYCRHYQSAESVTSYYAPTRLPLPEIPANPTPLDPQEGDLRL
jgi:hypothetical protein